MGNSRRYHSVARPENWIRQSAPSDRPQAGGRVTCAARPRRRTPGAGAAGRGMKRLGIHARHSYWAAALRNARLGPAHEPGRNRQCGGLPRGATVFQGIRIPGRQRRGIHTKGLPGGWSTRSHRGGPFDVPPGQRPEVKRTRYILANPGEIGNRLVATEMATKSPQARGHPRI